MPESLGSRSGDSGPFGKLTEQVSLLLAPRTVEALTALAVVNNMPRSEYMRMVFERHCFGEVPTMQARYARGHGASMVRTNQESGGE